jgi:hypothetical protein
VGVVRANQLLQLVGCLLNVAIWLWFVLFHCLITPWTDSTNACARRRARVA